MTTYIVSYQNSIDCESNSYDFCMNWIRNDSWYQHLVRESKGRISFEDFISVGASTITTVAINGSLSLLSSLSTTLRPLGHTHETASYKL